MSATYPCQLAGQPCTSIVAKTEIAADGLTLLARLSCTKGCFAIATKTECTLGEEGASVLHRVFASPSGLRNTHFGCGNDGATPSVDAAFSHSSDLIEGLRGSHFAPKEAGFRVADFELEELETPTFVDVTLIDDAGQALRGEPYKLILPDGRVLTGALDAGGNVRVERIPNGSCRIEFPRLDQSTTV